MLLDCAVTSLDAAPTAPAAKALVGELPAVVRDEHLWPGSCPSEGSVEKASDRFRGRLLLEHGESHDSPREVIDSDSNPPAERPALCDRPRHPGAPEVCGSRDRRQIHVPDILRPLGADTTCCRHRLGDDLPVRSSSQHPADSRGAEMQPSTAQDIGDARLAHDRAKDLEATNKISHEGGILVDWLTGLDQGAMTVFIQPTHPGSHRRRGDEQALGSLFQRPAAGSAQLQDGESLNGLVEGTPTAWDTSHTSVLQTQLLLKKGGPPDGAARSAVLDESISLDSGLTWPGPSSGRTAPARWAWITAVRTRPDHWRGRTGFSGRPNIETSRANSQTLPVRR